MYDYLGEQGIYPDSQKVISYNQKFLTPYIGLSFSGQFNRFEIDTFIKYSKWSQIKDTDNHYLRSIKFSGNIKDSFYSSIDLNISYQLSQNLNLLSAFTYNIHNGKSGTLDGRLYKKNTQTSYLNSAGVELNNYFLNIGLEFKF